MPKKHFFYYVKGLILLQNINKQTLKLKSHTKSDIEITFSRKCRLYCQLLIIAKNFKEDENTCNSCFKIISGINMFDRMRIICKDNSQHRVFTNLRRSFAQEIMNKEDLMDKYKYIDINKYNCKTTQALNSFEIKENRQGAPHLHCSTNNSNVNMQNTYHTYGIKYSLTYYRG